MEVSMAERKVAEKLLDISFWGKIFGETNEYLIVAGLVAADYYPQQKFYFCTNQDFKLKELKCPDEFSAKAEVVTSRFTGDSSTLLEEEADEGETFSEVHRLAHTVAKIHNDTAVVPRGAWIVTATHEIVRNRAFEGAGNAAGGKLSSYFHFRRPDSDKRAAALDQPGIVPATDFLDPLSEDAPDGAWAVQGSASGSTVAVRSLVWPGYHFSHDVTTGAFAGQYFGDGLKNADIAFMLP